jgi:hypothetical protein
MTTKQKDKVRRILELHVSYMTGYNIYDSETDAPVCYDTHYAIHEIERTIKEK